MDMKSNKGKSISFGVALLFGNVLIAFVMAYLAAMAFDSPSFNNQLLKWRETGIYPYPRIILYLIPGLTVWPIASEVTYQVGQLLVWGANGYIVKRHFQTMKPIRWTWVPFAIHILLLNPIQIVLGPACYYLMAKDSRNVTMLQK